MTELIFAESVAIPDDEMPSYNKPGRILFEVDNEAADSERVTVHDYDQDSGVFWLQEGLGIEYWLGDMVADVDDLPDGMYLMLGVTGTYIRGDGYTTDDDEDWDFDYILSTLHVSCLPDNAIVWC